MVQVVVCTGSVQRHREAPRSILFNDTCVQLIHSLVRLDYCNSILYGLPANRLYRLQIIQNIAANE